MAIFKALEEVKSIINVLLKKEISRKQLKNLGKFIIKCDIASSKTSSN